MEIKRQLNSMINKVTQGFNLVELPAVLSPEYANQLSKFEGTFNSPRGNILPKVSSAFSILGKGKAIGLDRYFRYKYQQKQLEGVQDKTLVISPQERHAFDTFYIIEMAGAMIQNLKDRKNEFCESDNLGLGNSKELNGFLEEFYGGLFPNKAIVKQGSPFNLDGHLMNFKNKVPNVQSLYNLSDEEILGEFVNRYGKDLEGHLVNLRGIRKESEANPKILFSNKSLFLPYFENIRNLYEKGSKALNEIASEDSTKGLSWEIVTPEDIMPRDYLQGIRISRKETVGGLVENIVDNGSSKNYKILVGTANGKKAYNVSKDQIKNVWKLSQGELG